MPQMSPIMWSFIIIITIYNAMMISSNMNYMKMPMKKNNKFNKNTKKMMW